MGRGGSESSASASSVSSFTPHFGLVDPGLPGRIGGSGEGLFPRPPARVAPNRGTHLAVSRNFVILVVLLPMSSARSIAISVRFR